jgi:hypothetical protein
MMIIYVLVSVFLAVNLVSYIQTKSFKGLK